MRTWNKIFAFVSLGIASSLLNAQSMPQIGSITSPKMPTLSSPTIGGGFYKPESSSLSFPVIESSVTSNTENNQKTTEEKKSEVKQSKLSDFSLFTSLLQGEPLNQGTILRFRVEDIDILSTTKNITVKSIKENLSILISGTNLFQQEKKQFAENFYFLLTPDTTKNALANYKVNFIVNQEEEIPDTPLYHLSLKENITALRTGNLIKINMEGTDFLADLGEF